MFRTDYFPQRHYVSIMAKNTKKVQSVSSLVLIEVYNHGLQTQFSEEDSRYDSISSYSKASLGRINETTMQLERTHCNVNPFLRDTKQR